MENENATFVLISKDKPRVLFLSEPPKSIVERGDLLVFGRCMAPWLLPGDRVRVSKVDHRVRLGWIMVFQWGDSILSHRVVKVRGEKFWARGDSSPVVQGPVDPSAVLGRVVARERDGVWRSLNGISDRAIGLAYNQLLSLTVSLVMRRPALRRFAEVDVLSSRFFRRFYRKVGRVFLGHIVVEEEKDVQRVLGAMVSKEFPLSQGNVSKVQSQHKRKSLKLFVARSSRCGRIGNVSLSGMRQGKSIPTGIVSTLVVSLGARRLGIGRMLVAAVEDAAREDGLRVLRALVARDNVAVLGLFQNAGYKVVPRKGLDRMSSEQPAVGGDGQWLLEKELTQAVISVPE